MVFLVFFKVLKLLLNSPPETIINFVSFWENRLSSSSISYYSGNTWLYDQQCFLLIRYAYALVQNTNSQVLACAVLMHVRYTKGSLDCKSLFCPSTECPRLQTHVVRQEEKEGSKLPSNPEEVEYLRRDTAGNPLVAFTFNELKLITGNFRQDNVLGVGGFGRVYKGLISEDLRDGLQPLQVAVKVHDGDNSHQGHREWLVSIANNSIVGSVSLLCLCYNNVAFTG